mmetsp:Transcript_159088/g.510222  ORF Transcript_159088/g.510222 Transcript_159088/m.510222 type:complete len:231 (+) Transcript_159088:998-1690(+)
MRPRLQSLPCFQLASKAGEGCRRGWSLRRRGRNGGSQSCGEQTLELQTFLAGSSAGCILFDAPNGDTHPLAADNSHEFVHAMGVGVDLPMEHMVSVCSADCLLLRHSPDSKLDGEPIRLRPGRHPVGGGCRALGRRGLSVHALRDAGRVWRGEPLQKFNGVDDAVPRRGWSAWQRGARFPREHAQPETRAVAVWAATNPQGVATAAAAKVTGRRSRGAAVGSPWLCSPLW